MSELDNLRWEQPTKEIIDLLIPNVLAKYWTRFENLTKIVLSEEERLFVDSLMQRKKLQIELRVQREHNERIASIISWTADNYIEQPEILAEAA